MEYASEEDRELVGLLSDGQGRSGTCIAVGNQGEAETTESEVLADDLEVDADADVDKEE